MSIASPQRRASTFGDAAANRTPASANTASGGGLRSRSDSPRQRQQRARITELEAATPGAEAAGGDPSGMDVSVGHIQRAPTLGTNETIQRKVFLFSKSRHPNHPKNPSGTTPLSEGASWFSTKPNHLTPSDPDIYQNSIQNQYSNHRIVDMSSSVRDYLLGQEEAAIIVSHGALGGSLTNDADEDVMADVIDTVLNIAKANAALPPIRIFLAACNSARADAGTHTVTSPIERIVVSPGVSSLFQAGKLIFEGYTAQTGLADYARPDVGPDKEGKHIWGKNKVLASGEVKDTAGAGQKFFGYDQALTARAQQDVTGQVRFSQTSKALADGKIGKSDIKSNPALYATMADTSTHQAPATTVSRSLFGNQKFIFWAALVGIGLTLLVTLSWSDLKELFSQFRRDEQDGLP